MMNEVVTKKLLVECLKKSPLTIDFVKADGTNRRILASLRPDDIPSEAGSGNQFANEAEDTVTFWSIDDHGWRRCKMHKINEIWVPLSEVIALGYA